MDVTDAIEKVKIFADILRVLNHEERLQIIQTLHHNPGLTVTQIASKVEVHRSIVSQHCKALKQKQIIQEKSNSENNKYINNYPTLVTISKALNIITNL